MNWYAMNMIAKQQQAEIRRKADLQRRLQQVDGEHRKWKVERSVLAMMILVVPLSLWGVFILM